MPEGIVAMTISLSTGALATFFAIMLWPRTRDIAWMLVIIGIIIHYGALVFQALEVFGIARVQLDDPVAAELLRAILTNVPLVFYIIASLVMIKRRD